MPVESLKLDNFARSAVADRQRDEAGVVTRLHPHQTVRLPSVRALPITLRTSAASNRLAGDFEDHVAGREAVVGGDTGGIDAGDHHAFAAGARDARGRRQREAELAEIGAVVVVLSVSALACCCSAIRRASAEVFSEPLCRTESLTAVFGASAPIALARSRASLTASPSTAVITSPASMPALAAGLSSCGSATSAPSAFFRPRLSAMSASPVGSARRSSRA